MKKYFYSIMRGIYLITLCATLPITLWAFISGESLNGTARISLTLATYLYAPIWILFFGLAGLQNFPRTIIGGLEVLCAPLINYALMFVILKNSSTTILEKILAGGAHYFQASTFVLAITCTVLITKAFRHKKLKPQEGNAALIAVSVMGLASMGYALLINYNFLTNAFSSLLKGTAEASFIIFLATIILNAHGFIRTLHSQEHKDITKDTESASYVSMRAENWWTNFIVALFLLSSLASILVVALGKG